MYRECDSSWERVELFCPECIHFFLLCKNKQSGLCIHIKSDVSVFTAVEGGAGWIVGGG